MCSKPSIDLLRAVFCNTSQSSVQSPAWVCRVQWFAKQLNCVFRAQHGFAVCSSLHDILVVCSEPGMDSLCAVLYKISVQSPACVCCVQWFASVEGFREQALAAIKEVTWIPAVGENRIRTMTEGRADWCISRQRKWGLPIPVFYYKDSGMLTFSLVHIPAM